MATLKPDLTRVWANGAPPANVVDPDTTTPGKVLSGWQAEVPPFEHFNFLQKWFTQGLAHANEQGIMIWDTDTTYPVDGLVKGSDGELYRAVLEQSGNDPVSDDGTNWQIGITRAPFGTVALMTAKNLAAGQLVETSGYNTPGDKGAAKYLIKTAAEFGGTPNELSDHTLNNGNIAVLQIGIVINPAQWGVSNSANDYLSVQAIYDTVSDHTIIDAAGLTVRMDALVTLTDKNNITTQNGNWYWNHQGTNMIKLSGSLVKPYFRNMECFGNGDAFASQGCIGCPSGTITSDWTVELCTFNQMPFGVYVNADSSGTHTRPRMIHNTFQNMKRDTVADTSGMGNGLVFAAFSGSIIAGESIGNSFRKCGRHGLYITSGGNVTSIGDNFDDHRNDGSPFIVTGLAALFVARNSKNVNIIAPVFRRCVDIALSIQAVQFMAAQTFGGGVNVISPIFDGNFAGDFEIGNDSPAANGWFDNVSITDIKILQYGNSVSTRGLILSGTNIKVEGVMITANQDEGVQELGNVIRIEDTATNISQFNNITVKDIRGTDTGSNSKGVQIDAGLLDGTLDVDLVVEDIKFGTSSTIFESGVVPVNPNYLKLLGNKPVVFSAFTGTFTNQNAEINRVDKYAGKKIFSLSGGLIKPLFASGTNPTDTWVDGVGTVVHTPV